MMFAIGIVAHQDRASQAHALHTETHADYISMDTGHLGCDLNHHAVLTHLAGINATHCVVLEDDALPVPGFRDQLAHALPLSPSPVVSLYLGRQRPPQHQAAIEAAVQKAAVTEADWIISTRLLHAVGYAIKTELVPSLLDYLSSYPVDQHISAWAMSYGHTVSYAYPSLVDHADTPTVIPRHPDGQDRPPGRVAWNTAPHDYWTTNIVPLNL